MNMLEEKLRQYNEKYHERFIETCYNEATKVCKDTGINFLDDYVNELLEQQQIGNDLKEYIRNFADDETKCTLDAIFYWAAYYKITKNNNEELA